MTVTTVLVSPCRSGSNAFSTMMGNSESVFVIHQPVKAGVRYGSGSNSDFSVYNEQNRGKYFKSLSWSPKNIFVKETVGHTGPECNYEIFPSVQVVREAVTTFLFRDPIACWNSWKRYGFGGGDIKQFMKAYKHVYDTFNWARDAAPDNVACLTYEHWMDNTTSVAAKVCQRSEIVFAENMIKDWQDIYASRQKVWIHKGDIARIKKSGHDVGIRSSKGVNQEVKTLPLQLLDEERRFLTKELRPLYESVHIDAQIYFPVDRKRHEKN